MDDTFNPSTLDRAVWEELRPLYRSLLERPIGSAAELRRWLLDRSQLDAAVSERRTNLNIATTSQTDDRAAKEAFLRFVAEVEPEHQELAAALDRRIVDSPFARELEGDEHRVLLRDLRGDLALFRQENIQLQAELSGLEQEYIEVSGALTVSLSGSDEPMTMAQAAKQLTVSDWGAREAAWRAQQGCYRREGPTFDRIFDDMLELRGQQAVNAGFDNFRDYQHLRLRRFDYSPADCERFHGAVEAVVVPLQRTLRERRASALGVRELRPWDLVADLQKKAPLRPWARIDELIEGSSRVFHRLHPELGQIFDAMRSGGGLDLESRPGKAPGGYHSHGQRTQRPFIFMNAAGTHHDVVALMHESGHVFHSTLCAEQPLLHYRDAIPMEFAEVASMGMEMLTLPLLGEFYPPEEAARARLGYLEEIVRRFVWVAQVDAFQHWAYTHRGHTKAERRASWSTLMRRFDTVVDYDGLEELVADSWHAQIHIFCDPFYYIEYAIAQLGALQLWVQARRDRARALDNYMRALSLGGSRPVPELYEAAGIRFDLGEATLGALMEELRRELAP